MDLLLRFFLFFFKIILFIIFYYNLRFYTTFPGKEIILKGFYIPVFSSFLDHEREREKKVLKGVILNKKYIYKIYIINI